MTRCFTNTTVDRLAGMPGATHEPKYIEGRRNRVGHRHEQKTVAIAQLRKFFKVRVTDGINFAINRKSRLDSFVGQFDRKVTNINSYNVDTRRCHGTAAPRRLADSDANTATGGTVGRRSLLRATHGLTEGTSPPRRATNTLPEGSEILHLTGISRSSGK